MSAWAWAESAACRGADLSLFFGPGGERSEEKAAREARAIAVCDRCPVRAECLAYALAAGLKHGIWGGMTEDERVAEHRRATRRLATAKRREAGEAA